MIICFDSAINYLKRLACGVVNQITALDHEDLSRPIQVGLALLSKFLVEFLPRPVACGFLNYHFRSFGSKVRVIKFFEIFSISAFTDAISFFSLAASAFKSRMLASGSQFLVHQRYHARSLWQTHLQCLRRQGAPIEVRQPFD